jgi:hypothetical protein
MTTAKLILKLPISIPEERVVKTSMGTEEAIFLKGKAKETLNYKYQYWFSAERHPEGPLIMRS